MKTPSIEAEITRSARLPLNAVRVFEAVAAHCSFSAAAEALHVTTAAVSMQIKSLEDYLQVQLFRRSARDVQLTAEGQALLPFVKRGLEELEQGFRTVKTSRASGAVVVSTLSSFLQKWLLPRIPAFREAHPDIDLQIRSSISLVDFARDDVHVAIRMGRGDWPRVHVEKILDEWLVPVCTPALFKRYGALRGFGDTGDYPLIHGASEAWAVWRDGSNDSDSYDVWPTSGMSFDDSVTLLHAAEQGQGLVLSRWSLASSLIESGQLVMPSPRAMRFSRSYYFVCPESYLTLAKVAKLRDWLLAAAKLSPLPPL